MNLIVEHALHNGLDEFNQQLFRDYGHKIDINGIATIYCHVDTSPKKRKCFGFLCRDFLLRSLEKADITGEKTIRDSAKFEYNACTVDVTQEFEKSRLKITVIYFGVF